LIKDIMKKIQLQDIIATEHKEILFKQKGNARMILAYHTYGNGICFGGVRLLPFDAGEKAVKDALRLSEAMTYKLSSINSPYGGCKAVVFEPKDGKTTEFLHNIGELIEEEKGRFISAIDFGFEPDDAKVIRETTKYIFAIKDSEFGQSGVTTAYGTVEGIKTSLEQIYGSSLIAEHSFAIQGLGSVGYVIADELIKLGGKVFVSDPDLEKTKQFEGRATIINPDEIAYLEVDVFVPCGPAYIINQDSIPKLKCKIIAGAANCQLEDEVEDDKKLHELGILIAPDYVINAGGVMQGIEELIGGSLEDAKIKLPIISENLKQIYIKSKQENRGTYVIAKEIAISKIRK
jgi:leucine dehydrogenase